MRQYLRRESDRLVAYILEYRTSPRPYIHVDMHVALNAIDITFCNRGRRREKYSTRRSRSDKEKSIYERLDDIVNNLRGERWAY
jgi:hypothetical protein